MFQFKRFNISDDRSAMKIGTDGVLLGVWSSLPDKGADMLDIGCGSGIVSLIVAQKCEGNIKIDAIDIDEGAVEDSKINFLNSPWHNVFNVIYDNFVSYSKKTLKQYNFIISNPPFYTQETTSSDISRRMARNNSSLSFDNLFKGVCTLLQPKGVFSMIAPAESYSQIAQAALLNKLYLHRLTWVVTVQGMPPKRVLVEWGREQQQFTIDELVITDNDGNYTFQYQQLIKDFYL